MVSQEVINISILAPPRWISIFTPTCIEAGDVSDIFMLQFAREAVNEGDGLCLHLSEGLCLFMICTKKPACWISIGSWVLKQHLFRLSLV